MPRLPNFRNSLLYTRYAFNGDITLISLLQDFRLPSVLIESAVRVHAVRESQEVRNDKTGVANIRAVMFE